ncbi:MAG: thiamine pyrophosphate-dependent enzyme, partial [Myxococcota bacterium]|nr:thiamine pyrophosphate-dependent enzyme [Myxococcota bacterium]
RSKQHPHVHGLFDVLLGLVASADEPIAGGRHKVFGSLPLNIPPQTSTIASHLPKAVGAAFSISRQKRLNISPSIPNDSIVVCSFGDASSNHATACAAFNAAALAEYQNLPLPILFVCEDNGIGISTRTPKNWLNHRFSSHPSIKYFNANGLDVIDALDSAEQAVSFVRRYRKPAILHINVIRLLGHAGSDVEQLYRNIEEIERLESQDPLIATASLLINSGLLRVSQIQELYRETRERIVRLGQEAIARPKIQTAIEVIAPLNPIDSEQIAHKVLDIDSASRKSFWKKLPEEERPRHMAMLLNRALTDIMLQYPKAIIFGEDVAKKGGVYHVTADLYKRFGTGRVFNTPLDETTILGLAIGSGQLGMLPIPEIQYLAYIHNALDQIRGEACSQQFFSQGQFSNPMVIRIASLAYQKGFGGHFHNDNSIAALRDIPGLIIACPSNGQDAVGMMRTSVAAAHVNHSVVAFLEPIALYMTKDLHEDKDGLWSFQYPPPDHHVPIGSARLWTEGDDLTIISYANGLWMSLRVAERLKSEGITCNILDLRWLNPLPEQDILSVANKCNK